MIVIDRYDPRLDKDELKEIFEDFIENKSHFYSHWQKFENELNRIAGRVISAGIKTEVYY